jgi:hypothetical protein
MKTGNKKMIAEKKDKLNLQKPTCQKRICIFCEAAQRFALTGAVASVNSAWKQKKTRSQKNV